MCPCWICFMSLNNGIKMSASYMIQSNWAIGSSHVAGWPGDWPGWLSYGHLPNLVLDFDQFWPILTNFDPLPCFIAIWWVKHGKTVKAHEFCLLRKWSRYGRSQKRRGLEMKIVLSWNAVLVLETYQTYDNVRCIYVYMIYDTLDM